MNLAEQVKLPFLQIAHAAELIENEASPELVEKNRKNILLSSQAALRLIDGYLLSVELQRDARFELEPVSLSSVLYDTAQSMHEYAIANGCKLQLQVGGKYGPVMANRRAVQAALMGLSYSFIEATLQANPDERQVIKLSVNRSGKGISTGVFMGNLQLSSSLLDRAKAMRGKVHQPIPGFDSGTGTGIFIADALFVRMHTNLRVARSGGLSGMAATLLPSRQLSLV